MLVSASQIKALGLSSYLLSVFSCYALHVWTAMASYHVFPKYWKSLSRVIIINNCKNISMNIFSVASTASISFLWLWWNLQAGVGWEQRPARNDCWAWIRLLGFVMFESEIYVTVEIFWQIMKEKQFNISNGEQQCIRDADLSSNHNP